MNAEQQKYAQPLQNVYKADSTAPAPYKEQLKESLTRQILDIQDKKRGRYKLTVRVQFKNTINGSNGYIEFVNILNETWTIIQNGAQKFFRSVDDLLRAGWVMNYSQCDLDGLKRFRRIAKEKANIENTDRILLGYKVEDYIHLYLDDPTPGCRQTLGCWGTNRWGIVEYAPPKIEFNGMTYEQHNPVSIDSTILDDLIATVICNRDDREAPLPSRNESHYSEWTEPAPKLDDIAKLSRAIKLEPNNAMLYKNRGDIYFNNGDYEEAIADYNQAILRDPHFEAAKQSLEKAQRQMMRNNL